MTSSQKRFMQEENTMFLPLQWIDILYVNEDLIGEYFLFGSYSYNQAFNRKENP